MSPPDVDQEALPSTTEGQSEPPYSPTQPYFPGLNRIRSGLSEALDYTLLQEIEAPNSHDFPNGYFACADFFKSLGPASFHSGYGFMEWHYNKRREAQMILPFLYVGPTSAARNIEFVKGEGITYLLGIRGPMPYHERIVCADKCAAQLGIKSDYIVLEDDEDLAQSIPDIIRSINDHLCCCPVHIQPGSNAQEPISDRPLKKVLIFCETGNERSAAIAIAYLMAIMNYDLVKAFINVQGRRYCCNLTDPLKGGLHTFESVLTAKRDLAKAQSDVSSVNGNPRASSPRKRAIDAIHEGDSAVNVPDVDPLEMDQQRFASRNSQQPFSDSPFFT
ncbi:dual specificity protein phosphatase 3 [Paracoccidioides lutzii Pb01]|uniref:Dual specificity protein phosphatase 3 n=1 Tax=Paracoccidioides lutzii (strain ATCC MYA-826 / Pb01) TaxID=502779 RepID=C1GPT1_PARBA|nr:dual specificity protein phosphatase 3 [Paracoccidioides lutzii Pb01]EEH36203.1 dual specificity protein phosphatase 3 [Paracoccidioides lutzii Pb01]